MTIYLLKMVMFQLQIVKYLEGNWFQICKFWWFSPDKWHDDPDSHDFTDDSIHVVADDDGDEKLWWWQLLSLSLLILLYLSIYYIYVYYKVYIYTYYQHYYCSFFGNMWSRMIFIYFPTIHNHHDRSRSNGNDRSFIVMLSVHQYIVV